MDKLKRTVIKAGEEVKKCEPSYFTDRNVKW